MGNDKQNTEDHGAHSGFRKGAGEYNDGANIDINGGNDDYPQRNFILDAFHSGPEPDESTLGKIAFGNNLTLEDVEENQRAG